MQDFQSELGNTGDRSRVARQALGCNWIRKGSTGSAGSHLVEGAQCPVAHVWYWVYDRRQLPKSHVTAVAAVVYLRPNVSIAPSWLLGEPLPTQWDSAHIQESKANRAASHRHEFTSFCIWRSRQSFFYRSVHSYMIGFIFAPRNNVGISFQVKGEGIPWRVYSSSLSVFTDKSLSVYSTGSCLIILALFDSLASSVTASVGEERFPAVI